MSALVFTLCLSVLGRECAGIHFAVNYLETWQKRQSGRPATTSSNDYGDAMDTVGLSATDKRVIVIGGGDTGVDCIATALRQASVVVVVVVVVLVVVVAAAAAAALGK